MKFITKSILGMPKRRPQCHKGDFGRVLVVAGSEDYPGAAVLASMASEAILRCGADYVTVAAPKKVAWVINTYLPDVITRKFNCSFFTAKNTVEVVKLSKDYDVVLIGPGLGEKSISFAAAIAKKIRKPKVIDADAIKGVKIQELQNTILTPHRKEFEMLLKNSRLNPENFQKKLGTNILLVKAAVDHIVSKETIAYNRTGNAVMTKAGTGDVLAGLCAGFAAQTNDMFRSACMAAYLNGAVGDKLLKKKGRTFIASDIPKNLSEVYR